MFATLERDPLQLKQLGPGLEAYVQIAGGFAGIALLLWLVHYVVTRRRRESEAESRSPVSLVFVVALVLSAIAYVIYGILWLPEAFSSTGIVSPTVLRFQNYALTAGGALALFAIVLPFIPDAVRFRGRRIWALARLSFKEAVRRKVLWVFLGMLLVLLFASWFIPYKREEQVRIYVKVVSFAMSALLLLVAGLLAAFGIPSDLKSQTIHTILTKPVERFEVVVGRFLGYTFLLTLVLVVMSAFSLLYVLRGIDPDAAQESLKAREALYGDLEFEGTKDRFRAENVGKEDDRRSYISGPDPRVPGTQYAVWKFKDLPGGLAGRDDVPCEFRFDIYRTHKGKVNEGIFCTFIVQTRNFDPAQKSAYENERRQLKQRPNPDTDRAIDSQLAEKYGYYEQASKEVRNFHTFHLDVPGDIFKNAQQARPSGPSHAGAGDQPDVQVRVRCESRQQFVGMAKYDLYFRTDAGGPASDWRRFIWNYGKSQVGLWLQLCLVVGVAVSLSTYLSGLISFLATACLYIGGLCKESIRAIGEGAQSAAGPFEAAYRLALRDMSGQLDDTTTFRMAYGSDAAYRWFLRLMLNLLPDVDRFDLSSYVADGFNIPADQLLVTTLLLAGYVALVALGAHYLIKWREIASTS